MNRFFTILIGIQILFTQSALAQFNLSGQILNRSEYRHGYGNLIDSGVNPAFSIGQRSRLNATYQVDKVRMGMAIQDIRTWGNTPQTKITDGFLSVHEAWLEFNISPKFAAKIGRQELDYDDARFLGNLDWALQARAHDIALLKYTDSAQKLSIHGGFAYNQTADVLSGNYYNLVNQYKLAQFFWFNKKWDKFTLGGLIWNNGLQGDSAVFKEEKVLYTTTIGLPVIRYQEHNWTFNGFFYYQFGNDIKDRKVNAIDASAEVNYTRSYTHGKKLSATLGVEYLSGTSQTDTANKEIKSYNPMYGTNHRHNGYMDYFYVGGRHLNSVGLIDGYFNLKYDFNSKFFAGMNLHYFQSAAAIRDTKVAGIVEASSYLGTELDLTAGYIFNDVLSFQAGYSQMFASESMKLLRGGNAAGVQNWGYFAILFRPNMKNKFTGLKW